MTFPKSERERGHDWSACKIHHHKVPFKTGLDTAVRMSTSCSLSQAAENENLQRSSLRQPLGGHTVESTSSQSAPCYIIFHTRSDHVLFVVQTLRKPCPAIPPHRLMFKFHWHQKPRGNAAPQVTATIITIAALWRRRR